MSTSWTDDILSKLNERPGVWMRVHHTPDWWDGHTPKIVLERAGCQVEYRHSWTHPEKELWARLPRGAA